MSVHTVIAISRTATVGPVFATCVHHVSSTCHIKCTSNGKQYVILTGNLIFILFERMYYTHCNRIYCAEVCRMWKQVYQPSRRVLMLKYVMYLTKQVSLLLTYALFHYC
jgi:hypothetical protein